MTIFIGRFLYPLMGIFLCHQENRTSMHPENIKAELRIRFGTVKAFERSKGLGVDSVRDVLRGRSIRRTADAIADSLGETVTSLFPGRFTEERDNTSRKRDSHRLNQGAA